MKIEVIELGGTNKTHIIDTKEYTHSVNILVSTNYGEEDEDNMLLSFDEKGDKINCYDSDGEIISDEKPKMLDFNELVKYFTEEPFQNEVSANVFRIIAYTHKGIDELTTETLDYIKIGCTGKEHHITFHEDKKQFRLFIKL